MYSVCIVIALINSYRWKGLTDLPKWVQGVGFMQSREGWTQSNESA